MILLLKGNCFHVKLLVMQRFFIHVFPSSLVNCLICLLLPSLAGFLHIQFNVLKTKVYMFVFSIFIQGSPDVKDGEVNVIFPQIFPFLFRCFPFHYPEFSLFLQFLLICAFDSISAV